jgi:hypothetical protein
MPYSYCSEGLELESVRREATRVPIRAQTELGLPSDARTLAQRSERSEKARDAWWDAFESGASANFALPKPPREPAATARTHRLRR